MAKKKVTRPSPKKKAKATPSTAKKAVKKKTAKKKLVSVTYSVPATGPLKLMVASTVYGFETEIKQLCAVLKVYGYDVLNSHIGTIRIPHGKDNTTVCVEAVNRCHLFFGIIRQQYGSGITHKEVIEAIRLDRPRWFVAHSYVAFCRQLFKQYKVDSKQKKTLPISIPFQRTPVMDNLKVIDMYEDAIDATGDIDDRKWAQEFFEFSELMVYVETNFKDHEWIRQECLKGVNP